MAERPRRHHDPRSVKGGGGGGPGALTAAASLNLAPAALMSQSPSSTTNPPSPPQPWSHLAGGAAKALLYVAVSGAVLTWTYAAYSGVVHGYQTRERDTNAVMAATGIVPRVDGCKPAIVTLCDGPDGACRLQEHPCGVPPPPSPAPPRPAAKELTRAQMLAEQLAEHRWQHEGSIWDQRDEHTGEHEHRFFHKPPPPPQPSLRSPPPPPTPAAPKFGHRGYSRDPAGVPQPGTRAAQRLEMARRHARTHHGMYNTVYGRGELGEDELGGGGGRAGAAGAAGGEEEAERAPRTDEPRSGEEVGEEGGGDGGRRGGGGGGRAGETGSNRKTSRRSKRKRHRRLQPPTPPAHSTIPPPQPPPTANFFSGRRASPSPPPDDAKAREMAFIGQVPAVQHSSGEDAARRR